jgi:hypothetical protein
VPANPTLLHSFDREDELDRGALQRPMRSTHGFPNRIELLAARSPERSRYSRTDTAARGRVIRCP